MTAQTASAVYRVEELRRAPDGLPLLGIRRPDGSWCQSMGQPAYYYSRTLAEEGAAELNRIHELTPQAHSPVLPPG